VSCIVVVVVGASVVSDATVVEVVDASVVVVSGAVVVVGASVVSDAIVVDVVGASLVVVVGGCVVVVGASVVVVVVGALVVVSCGLVVVVPGAVVVVVAPAVVVVVGATVVVVVEPCVVEVSDGIVVELEVVVVATPGAWQPFSSNNWPSAVQFFGVTARVPSFDVGGMMSPHFVCFGIAGKKMGPSWPSCPAKCTDATSTVMTT
jgi:hypothetical protein